MKKNDFLQSARIRMGALLVLGLMVTCPVFADSDVPQLTADPQQRTDVIFKYYDSDQNAELNEDEFAKAFIGLFSALDANHDDLLEADELPAGWNAEMDSVDRNHNNKIEFLEVIKHIEASFAARDTNADRKLDRNEVQSFMK